MSVRCGLHCSDTLSGHTCLQIWLTRNLSVTCVCQVEYISPLFFLPLFHCFLIQKRGHQHDLSFSPLSSLSTWTYVLPYKTDFNSRCLLISSTVSKTRSPFRTIRSSNIWFRCVQCRESSWTFFHILLLHVWLQWVFKNERSCGVRRTCPSWIIPQYLVKDE